MGTRLSTPISKSYCAAAEVVDHAHVVAPARQVQRRRPPQVPVAPQHEDPQAPTPFTTRGAVLRCSPHISMGSLAPRSHIVTI